MNIDQFFNKKYHKDNYNCAHFVADVWQELTGKCIDEALRCFLMPVKDRQVPIDLRRSFKRLSCPQEPCIVLMRRPKDDPHVGIFFDGKVMQITESGVSFLIVPVATATFKKVDYYQC